MDLVLNHTTVALSQIFLSSLKTKQNHKTQKEAEKWLRRNIVSRSSCADDKISELANERYNVFFKNMLRVLVKVSYILEKIMNFKS